MIKQIEIESGYKMPSDEEFVRWSDEAAAHKRPKIFQIYRVYSVKFYLYIEGKKENFGGNRYDF